MQKNVTRAFRLSKDLDDQIQENAREKGYLNPSDYLRAIVRDALEKEVQ